MLAPLGPWGMLAFAAVDGSFMGMPLDAIFVGYVYNDRSRFLLYVLLASAGSALGSIVLYVIGYTGGEVLLRKRLSRERFGAADAVVWSGNCDADGKSFAHHFVWILAGVGAVAVGWFLWRRAKRSRALPGVDGAKPRPHTN